MLTLLHTFANRPENIREVFLISFHDHHPNMTTNPGGNCNGAIGRAIFQTLCDNVTSCPAAYRRPTGSEGQWLSLAEMLRQGQRYVIMSDGDSAQPFIQPYEVRNSNHDKARKIELGEATHLSRTF